MIERRQLACSFCHQPETTVAKLVAGPRLLFVGPRVYICNRFIATAGQIMERDGGDKPPNPEPRRGHLQGMARRIARAWQRGGTRMLKRQAAAR